MENIDKNLNKNGKRNENDEIEMVETKLCEVAVINNKASDDSNSHHEETKSLLISDPSDEATFSNVEDTSTSSKYNYNNSAVEDAEDYFPMLRSSSRLRGRKQHRKYRNNGIQSLKKSKIQKEEAAQVSLISKTRSMIENARYEIEVDAYRGIFDDTNYDVHIEKDVSSNKNESSFQSCNNIFQRCTQKEVFYHPSQANEQNKNKIASNNFYDTFQCPCLQSWTIHPEDRINKRNNFNSNHKNDTYQQNNKPYQRAPKRRPIFSNIECVCDYNPLCILSLGGAMDDFLYDCFQKTPLPHNHLQHNNDKKNTIVDDEEGNFDSSAIYNSDENGSILISPSPFNNTTNQTSSLVNEDIDNDIHRNDKNMVEDSKSYEKSTSNNCKNKNSSSSSSLCQMISPVEEKITKNETFIIDEVDIIENDTPHTIPKTPQNLSNNKDNFELNKKYGIIDRNNNFDPILSRSYKNEGAICKNAGKVFTTYSNQNIMDVFDLLEHSNSQKRLEIEDEMKTNINFGNSRNNAIALGDVEFSQLRKTNWTTQETIQKYLRNIVLSIDTSKSTSPLSSPTQNKNIKLDVEKCFGIICAWHKHLTFAYPQHNTELNPYFRIWLPPTQYIGQFFAFGDTPAITDISEETIDSHSTSQQIYQNEMKKKINLAEPPGMKNLGATCYLNSQFQCLAQNPVFTVGVFSWNAKTASEKNRLSQNCPNNSNNDMRMDQILYSMQLLLSRMVYGHKNVVCTNQFSNALGLENNEMQDPNEFTRLLFDRMHESFQQSSLNMPSNITDDNKMKNSLRNLLPRLFGGICHNETTCLECGHKSTRKEDFMDLTLPIVCRNNDNNKFSETNKNNDLATSSLIICDDNDDDDDTNDFDFTKKNTWSFRDTTLQLCLDTYLQPEILDGENQYFCDNCNAKCDARRNITFSSLPQVFNIQLARYVFDRKELMKRKLTNRVLLPRILFVPQIANNRDNDENDEKKIQKGLETDTQYILCAVQNHRGKSAYGGHYVAEAMDWTTGVWYEYNDEKVTMLPNGPSNSYSPLVPEKKRNQDNSSNNSLQDDDSSRNEKNQFNFVEIDTDPDPKEGFIRGSTDAYNLFYVEKSFLSRCAKRQLLHYHDHVKLLQSTTKNNEEHLQICQNATFKVTKERMETYKIMSQKYTQGQYSSERLLRRKAGILQFLIPQLIKMNRSQSYIGSDEDLDNNDKNEEKIWVDGSTLRRFMSCNDEMNDIFSKDVNQPLLRNKVLVCEHGVGLHPRSARTGKILNKEAYNAYISLLCGEKEYVNNINVSGRHCTPIATDHLITTKKNLFCATCAQNYRNELKQKLNAMELFLELQDDLNSAYSDVDPSNFNDGDTETFHAVSRSFLTSFRKYSQNKLKEFVGLSKHQGSKSNRSSTCSLEGIDKVHFSEILPENFGFIPSSINAEKTCLAVTSDRKNTGEEKLDEVVNTKIICPHGNLNSTNKRFVRYVPSTVWEKINFFFPRAISIRADLDAQTKKNTFICQKCKDEKERMLRLEQSLGFWANDIASNGKRENGKTDSNELWSLYMQDKTQSSNRDDECIQCDTTTGNTFFIVHKCDVSAWRTTIRIIQSKRNSKMSKGSCGDMSTELIDFLFDKPSDIVESIATYDNLDNVENTDNVEVADRDISLLRGSEIYMKIVENNNVVWNMRRLICEEHKKTVGAPKFFTDILNVNYHDITDDSQNSSPPKNRNLGDYCIDPCSMKTCWILLKPSEYDAFISSINELSFIFSLFKRNILSSESEDKANINFTGHHPKIVLENCTKDFLETRPIPRFFSGSISSSEFNIGTVTTPRRLGLIPQLCINNKCINKSKNDKWLDDNAIFNSIVSPALVEELVIDDKQENLSKESELETEPFIESLQMKVHEFENVTSVAEMCETVKNRIIDENRRKNNHDSVRRSKRRRKSLNSKEEVIHEFPFSINGNLARLRLTVSERSETLGLIDQKLLIVCPHVLHDSQLHNSDKASERIISLDDISDNSMIDVIEHELSNDWNERDFSDILSSLSNAKHESGPSLSFGPEIHIILCRVDNISNPSMLSEGQKSPRQSKSEKEQKQELEEAFFTSLMEISDITESSPLAIMPKNRAVAPEPSCKKRRTERGFRGTFLQSNILGQSNELHEASDKHEDASEQVIIIDSDRKKTNTKILSRDLNQTRKKDDVDSPNSTKCLYDTMVVDISSDSSSDGSIPIAKSWSSGKEVQLVTHDSKNRQKINDLTAQDFHSPLRSNDIKTDDDFPYSICLENRDISPKNRNISKNNYASDLRSGENTSDIITKKGTHPTSSYDLSSPALCFTEPLYESENIAIPPLVQGQFEMESLCKEDMRQFVVYARKAFYTTSKMNLSSASPKIDDLIQLLPASVQNADIARHLYRNFIDSVDTLFENPKYENLCKNVCISRREMDIMLYFISNQKNPNDCHSKLIPYRKYADIRNMFKILSEKDYHNTYHAYMEHVNHCVATLLDLEDKGAHHIPMSNNGHNKEQYMNTSSLMNQSCVVGHEKFVEELVQELSNTLSSDYDFLAQKVTKSILAKKFGQVLKSTNYLDSEWKAKKQEFLDEVLALLFNEG